MNPIVILWPSVTDNTSSIVSASAATIGTPLTLNANDSFPNNEIGVQGLVPGNLVPPLEDGPRYSIIPNLGTGAQTLTYNMPKGNIRSVSITAATGTLGSAQFKVDGLDQNGNEVSVTGTPSTV